MASERTSHLTQDLPKSVGREGKEEREKRKEKGEILEIEALPYL